MKFILIVIAELFLIFSVTAQTNASEWPLFRGKADLAGKVDLEFPDSPKLLWSIKTGATTKSSPVISNDNIYFGNDKGTLTAVSSEGKILWKYESGSSIDAAPMVFGTKVIFGCNDGILRAVDRTSGKLLWSYTTENQIAGSANVWISGNKAGIVTGSYDYFLHCVDPETGKSLWKVETENYINGTPAGSGTNLQTFTHGTFEIGMCNNDTVKLKGFLDECIYENVIWIPQQVQKYYTFSKGRFL